MTKEETKKRFKAWAQRTIGNYCSREDEQMFNNIMALLEQQPKTGHWITTNDYVTTAYGSLDYYRCSCCGEDSLEEGDYCPNCGAKMEVEK